MNFQIEITGGKVLDKVMKIVSAHESSTHIHSKHTQFITKKQITVQILNKADPTFKQVGNCT